jgi:hypoxanthine-guanine phosphoribosyltransferase
MKTTKHPASLHTAEAQIFLSPSQIATHVGDLAARLQVDDFGEALVVGVLPEGALFTADLIRAMYRQRIKLTTGFVITGGSNSLTIDTSSLPDIRNKHVIFAHARVESPNIVRELADRASSQARQVTQVALVSHDQELEPKELDAALWQPSLPLYGYGIARQPDGANAHVAELYTY